MFVITCLLQSADSSFGFPVPGKYKLYDGKCQNVSRYPTRCAAVLHTLTYMTDVPLSLLLLSHSQLKARLFQLYS